MAQHRDTWGVKLGPRIAMLVSKAIVWTHVRLATIKHKVAMSVFHAMSDEISSEVDVTLGPLIQKIHDAIDETHPAYPGIHFMHTVSGQLKALAGTGLQISGLLGSVATVMNNELAPIVYNIVKANPGLLPDPGVISQSLAAGLVAGDEALSAIGAQGTQYGWAQRMLDLAYSRVDVTTSLDLLRRGLIDAGTFAQNTAWAGYLPADGELLAKLQTVPVSVADAALAVLRGNISQAEGETIAAQNGYDAAGFAILINNTGEPPGTDQLLEAYRRGIIDQATLERGILQSRYRNEWIPTLEALRYAPMSVADAVNAVVQDQLDATTAESIAQQNGLEPGQFSILYNTAGEPLSRTEMEELYNRGLVTQDQVLQALRESRLKNKYGDLAFALHTRVIEPGILERAVRYGGVSEADAVAKAMMSGYSTEDATTIVNSGIQQRIQTHKDRVVSAAASLYEAGVMSATDVTSVITSMGYSDAEATFILEAADYHKESRLLSNVVDAIRTKYKGWHIDENTASGLIDQVGLPTDQRDYLLALWTIERNASTRTLTEAQIVKAVADSLITSDDGMTRLANMGYNATDAALLLGGA